MSRVLWVYPLRKVSQIVEDHHLNSALHLVKSNKIEVLEICMDTLGIYKLKVYLKKDQSLISKMQKLIKLGKLWNTFEYFC